MFAYVQESREAADHASCMDILVAIKAGLQTGSLSCTSDESTDASLAMLVGMTFQIFELCVSELGFSSPPVFCTACPGEEAEGL